MATKRSPYDFYPTPQGAIDALLENLRKYNIDLGDRVLEPCAGDGALIERINMYYPNSAVQAYDIDESHLPSLQKLCEYGNILCYGIHDVLDLTENEINFFDTIITNPPFSISQEIVEHILEHKKPQTTFIILQRLGFLGSQKRHEMWNKYPPDAIWALSKRPSFTGQGTDAHEYGWFIWGDIKQAPPIIAI